MKRRKRTEKPLKANAYWLLRKFQTSLMASHVITGRAKWIKNHAFSVFFFNRLLIMEPVII